MGMLCVMSMLRVQTLLVVMSAPAMLVSLETDSPALVSFSSPQNVTRKLKIDLKTRV